MLAQLARLMGWLDADGELPASLSCRFLPRVEPQCLMTPPPGPTLVGPDLVALASAARERT